MKSTLKQELMKLKQKKSSKSEKIHQSNLQTFVHTKPKSEFQDVKKEKQLRKPLKNLFLNITFCFPHFDIELTKKQAEFIAKQIRQQGGTIIDEWQHLYFEPIQYLLVSSKARIQSIQKKIQNHINYIDILDYNFIPCCIAQEKIVDTAYFSLASQKKQNGEKKQKNSIQNFRNKKRKDEQKIVGSSQNQQKRSLTQELPPSNEQIESNPQQRNFKKPDKQKFFCHTGKQQNKPAMNKFIEQELLQLQKIYANQRDIGRRIAYGKAASIIKTWKEEIKTEEDVDKIMGIGPKINKKIKEIVSTGKLSKLEQFNQSQQVKAMGELSKVWGIGPAKARQLYNRGIRSIEQLKKDQSSLTKNQKIGLKYFEDFQKRISRQKVFKMFQQVQKTLNLITKNPEAYKAEVCGSYRRGKTTCGDIDIIITRKDGVFEKDLLVNLVASLQSTGFLTDNLSEPKCNQGHVSTSYMGVCKFEDDTHHRIDIKHYPLQQYAFALLYFTGSGMFNRSMRLYASKLGLQLSDKGFVRRPQKGDVNWSKPIPVCYNQQDIFKVLGLDYKTPLERDD